MQCKNSKTRIACPIARARGQGLTLLEMVIALAIITVIFAVIVPQFGMILNSWDSRAGAAETIQNGRVLLDHLNRNLSAAVKITAVSDSAETNGYIQFEDNDGSTLRYEITSNYVQFGEVGDLSDLAGPVSRLQFTCYDACDLNTAITDVISIRSVKVQTTMTNSAALGQDKTFTAWAYLRTCSASGTPESLTSGTSLEYDISRGQKPALAKIDSNYYLCAYTGDDSDGWAVVLTVDTDNWTISKGTAFEFDDVQATTPALAKIDGTRYLCVYTDKFSDGWAVVLTVDTDNWTISKGTAFKFDDVQATTPALAKIDSSHYLCTYADKFSDGQAVVLTIDTGTWNITKETPLEYDTDEATTPVLSKIDNSHYLCTYTGESLDGWAVVLTVDTGTWTISGGTKLEYDDLNGEDPALAQIDSTHYLCAYTGTETNGWAIVLTVDTGTWTISGGTKFEFDGSRGTSPALSQMDPNDYLCAYTGESFDGWAVVLTIDPNTWTITNGENLEFDTVEGQWPALAQIYPNNHLCAYEDMQLDGQAVVLTYNPATAAPVTP